MGDVGREHRWRSVIAPLERFRVDTLPHAAPRPLELLRPDLFLAGERLRRKLRTADLTVVTPRRARTLYRLACSVERSNIPGAIVDCGVRNGGSTMLLSEGAPSREIWAFDSFEGLPAPTAEDLDGPLLPMGAWRGSIKALRRGFESYGRPERLHVVAGWFEETLPNAPISALAVLRLDGDMYSSTMQTLDALYPKLSEGGFAIIDDYGNLEPCRQAVDDYRAAHGIREPIERIDWTGVYWRRH